MSDFEVYEGSAAWESMDFQTSDWIDVLAPEQRRELVDTASSLPEDDSQWLALKREDLHLPTLSPFLDKVNKGLEEGRGFAVLRGLDLPPAEIDFAYRVNWVLALGLGDVIAQNANGEVIGAVQAVTEADDNGMDTRGYVSNAELRFHCDGGDVASLLCVRQAPEGGSNSLVSMVSIHNAMVRECPDLLATLYRGLHMFMRKEGLLDSKVVPRQPLFFPQKNYLLGWVNLRLMELPYESTKTPMPAEERAALDALEEIAERSEYKLSLKLEPGDMLLTHNFVCMHKRSKFTDDPNKEKARLMLRLWYNLPESRVQAIQPANQRRGYFTQSPYVIRHRDPSSAET